MKPEYSKDTFIRELTERNEPSITGKLQTATIGIAGCGGLGSNVAAALTRIAVKKLIIVDFDTVLLSNLNRQFFFVDDIGKSKAESLGANLKRINPFIEIEMHIKKIDAENLWELFSNADIIVEAFDNAEQKAMLLNAFLEDEKFASKYLVCASGLAGFDSSNSIKTFKFCDRVFIAGDFTSESCEKGVMAPRVWIASAHQANMVVRIIAGIYEP